MMIHMFRHLKRPLGARLDHAAYHAAGNFGARWGAMSATQRNEHIALKLEAIALGLEAMATRVEAIASRLEATAIA